MSDPVRAPSAPPARKLHRLHPDDEAELAKDGTEQVVELDAEQTEAYLRWLETGEGPNSDPDRRHLSTPLLPAAWVESMSDSQACPQAGIG